MIVKSYNNRPFSGTTNNRSNLKAEIIFAISFAILKSFDGTKTTVFSNLNFCRRVPI